MSTVLVLAYHFPPLGGAGVQRNVKFVRYLRDEGWEPVVVTGAGERDAPWAPPDDTLLEEIARDVRIERIPAPEPALRAGAGAGAERLLGLVPPRTRWWIDRAVEVGRNLDDFDVIYASLIPYETAEAAAHLSAATGRPWVADLQDPWALDEMWLYPTGLHRARDLRRMRKLLASASAVIMNTPESGSRLAEAFPELASRTVVIPNGFDLADFERPTGAPSADGPFRIVHTGYLYTEVGLRVRRTALLRRLLGGFFMSVDIYPRSHAYLVDALDLLLERRPDLEGAFELHLAGSLSADDIRVCGSRAYVVRHGYVPHGDSVDLVTSADMLFLPMHDVPPGMRAGIVPGKTYEYLASGRPILAAVPAGDAADILGRIPEAVVCRPTDVDAMSRLVEEAIERRRNGETHEARDEDARALVGTFERRHLTRALAEVLEKVAGEGVAPMGRAAAVARRARIEQSLTSVVRRAGRVMAEEGVLSFVHRAGLRAAAPALAPAAATVLRRRAARASSLGEVADLVYGFDRFGIKLPPWQHRDELGRLLEILRQRNVRTVVEIGTGNGGTLFLLAQAASEDALVVSVDLPAGEFGGGYPIWRAALYHGFATRRQRIVLLRRDSHEPETVNELLKVLHERQIDFLFIDGDHSYQGVARDFEMYAPLVSPTGLIGFHDIIPGLSIPDRFRDRHGDDISCVGDVPRFWQELRARVPTTELVADWDQGRFGIGLVEVRDLAGTGGGTAPLRASKPRIA